MDPSALIFVALAVAWAVYLIPKALQHHDDAVRSRSVDRFSQTMRVLARREPVDRRGARLVVGPNRAAAKPVVTTKATTRTAPAGIHTEIDSESVAESVAETIAPTVPDGAEAPVRAEAEPPMLTPTQRRAPKRQV